MDAPAAKIQTPEAKSSSSSSSSDPVTMSAAFGRRWEAAAASVRTACLICSLLSLSLMLASEQRGDLSIFGLSLPLHSKWSYSDSLEYLVVVSGAAAAHSLLQLGLSVRKMVKKMPVIPSRGQAWIVLAGDQVFAYAMMSACSAAAGVTNLNRTGIRHSALPNFCKPLYRFCSRMAISIVFGFLSFLCLASSAVLDALWLSKC